MSTPPWTPDRDVDVARAAIRGAFPDVDVARLRHLGSGLEFHVFATADGWAFRFPQRAEHDALFDRERPVLELARSALPPAVAVPHVERLGAPSREFAYRFAGHRLVEGAHADTVPVALRAELARSIGAVLGAIHAVPLDAARAAGVTTAGYPPNDGALEWFRQNLAAASALVGSSPVVRNAVAWLSELDPRGPPHPAPLCFTHNDLTPEHLVADPATGRLTGILDWTFTAIGDAARDFVTCATFGGWGFVERVLEHYPRRVDGEFRHRLRFMAQWLSVIWLGEARRNGGDVRKQITWIENAYAPPTSAR